VRIKIAIASLVGVALIAGLVYWSQSWRAANQPTPTAEIAQLPSSSLYDLIQKVRPEFLRSRGTSSFNDTNTEYPVVFVDGRQYGDMASLRTLVSAQISQVRYYDAMAAQARFGVIKASGVIDVTVKQ